MNYSIPFVCAFGIITVFCSLIVIVILSSAMSAVVRKLEKPAPAAGTQITSPLPGTVLSINVTNGQAVKSGDVLFVLEAMKMENEIMAPSDGTVASISVAQGAAVDPGTLLCVLQ